MTPTALAISAVLALQASASQAPTGQASITRTEVADPMQIDVSLGADTDPKGQPRAPFNQQPVGKLRAYPDTDQFVCDQARVRMLTVKKSAESATEVVLDTSLTLISDWPLQDVDVALALVGSDGKVYDRQAWDNLTLGAWSHSYYTPRAQFHIPAADWHQLFSDGKSPLIRIVVDIQE
jgi:hypothetical protein